MTIYTAFIEDFIEFPGSEESCLECLRCEQQQILTEEIFYSDNGEKINRLSDIKLLTNFIMFLLKYRGTYKKAAIEALRSIYNEILQDMKFLEECISNTGTGNNEPVDEQDEYQASVMFSNAQKLMDKNNYIIQFTFIEISELLLSFQNITEHYHRIKTAYENLL